MYEINQEGRYDCQHCHVFALDYSFLLPRNLHSELPMRERPCRVEATVRTHPSVAEIVERRQTSLCVQRCLDYLPDHYRAVILMYEIHALTAPEIANLLGLRLTTVKMRLHRARRMLQQIMEYGCAVSDDHEGLPVCQPRE